jgi:hypothetical protein
VDKWSDARINLTRLGASSSAESVRGVLAVWVATSPARGAFVLGWYKDATVYRNWQAPPPGSARRYDGQECGYYVSARSDNAVLLPPDERVFPVPQATAGGFGKSNVWYANEPEKHRRLRLDLLRYVETRRVSKPPKAEGSHPPRQPDPLLRQKVEEAAIKRTTAYFSRLRYLVDSVEQDNVGWDLTAVLAKRNSNWR